MSDDELYSAYLAGDMSAGDTLMLRLGDALTGYLSSLLHDANDAEDLMLECFSVILVDKPKIADGHFKAYLFRVARNLAAHQWKLIFRRQEFCLDEGFYEELSVGVGGSPSPESTLLTEERNTILRRCLNRIAPQYREALWLYYEMDMSYAQTAEIMRRSAKQIEDLLRNGKKRLRLELEKEGITDADI